MKTELFPEDIRPFILPEPGGDLGYDCLKCRARLQPNRLYYTCPHCGGLLTITDSARQRLHEKPGSFWRRLFDYRRMSNHQAIRGVFLFHEFLAPLIPLTDIIYLGEGHTPAVAAPLALAKEVGVSFYVKLDGLNPSASFKDRGMAAALSYLKYLIRTQNLTQVMAICASTGDTSAAAALYSASLGGSVKSAVILPQGRVTPQQLSQPLGSGASVFETPGVFDDCMKVVEYLSERYQVALLNSKNPWRVLGQESYAYEVAQQFDYEVGDLALLIPVGNAGNITAILSGLLKFFQAGVIDRLPKIIAVQSERANPVFLYYNQPATNRQYVPVTVRPSVAQAAMIGDPVSFPRLANLADLYQKAAGPESFFAVEVAEVDIIEGMIQANRRGLPVCTQGGEGLAGLKKALALGLIAPSETAVVDSTAHALKFMDFQNAYFDGRLAQEYGITTRPELVNRPRSLNLTGPKPDGQTAMSPEDRQKFVETAAKAIAESLGLLETNEKP
ncbi:MAG: pyridoxal-phosphate dependent enzyme [Deltaproteobacteria bacterium]|jgi:threonine synthase|nr:pyridoxal-phosphate dependent enzyme [Deltaproteobacteria bacterium]